MSAEELFELVQLSGVPMDKELFKVVSGRSFSMTFITIVYCRDICLINLMWRVYSMCTCSSIVSIVSLYTIPLDQLVLKNRSWERDSHFLNTAFIRRLTYTIRTLTVFPFSLLLAVTSLFSSQCITSTVHVCRLDCSLSS